MSSDHGGTEILRADLDDPDHAGALLDLLDAFAREPVSGGKPLPEAVRKGLIPRLRSHPGTLVMLARDGDRYIGTAVCFTGFSTFYAHPLVNIHDLTVLPEHRGRGIGRLLLRAVEEEARRMGCCKVTLEVRADNDGARRLYGSEGFRGDGGSAENSYYFLQKLLT